MVKAISNFYERDSVGGAGWLRDDYGNQDECARPSVVFLFLISMKCLEA